MACKNTVSSVHETQVPPGVEPIVACSSNAEQLTRVIDATVCKLGFSSFAFVRMRRYVDRQGLSISLWGTFPQGYQQAYRHSSRSMTDPRWVSMEGSAIPVIWDREIYAIDPELNDFLTAGDAFGVCSGVCFVVRRYAANATDAFFVASSTEYLSPARRREVAGFLGHLWTIGVYAYKCLPGDWPTSGNDARDRTALSARESECLSLAARGATSRVIGELLEISERTVNAHLGRAIVKCQANNRSEAICRAIQQGWIGV